MKLGCIYLAAELISTAFFMIRSRRPVSLLVRGSDLLYDWLFTASQFVFARSPLRPMTSTFLFPQLNSCGYSPYLTSLWREDVRWASLAQSFSVPSPARRMTLFYCLKFENSQTCRARYPYLYLPGTRWLSYNPKHWVPFSSTPTTHRTSVCVFARKQHGKHFPEQRIHAEIDELFDVACSVRSESYQRRVSCSVSSCRC